MKKTACYTLLIILFQIYRYVMPGHGLKQQDALVRLNNAKTRGQNEIDTGDFRATLQDAEALLIPQSGSSLTDKIEKLPGQQFPVNCDQYGGYITVDQMDGRSLFYYFVEAENSKKHSLPLVLWLNGGPGCSSLIGAMEEIGPFRINSDAKTLYGNEFAWTNVANVLFLESPVGVGFSYSNSTSDYDKSGDKSTAQENYAFLVNWLNRFPQYLGRAFFIAGESYAGHYIPQLAVTIHRNNKGAKEKINLKGILMGNAVINDITDNIGMYDYFETHALISKETRNQLTKYCQVNATADSTKCRAAIGNVGELFQYIDVYNIYAPLCHSNITASPIKTSVKNYDPCSGIYLEAYLNRPEVQKALHANVTKLKYAWAMCSDKLTWNDSPATVINLLKELTVNGYRVWIFSGDIDGRVPVTSTKYTLQAMKQTVKTLWRPWMNQEEIAGFVEEYKENITFVTVKGAGHTVPSYKPENALLLFDSFLTGSTLPKMPNSTGLPEWTN